MEIAIDQIRKRSFKGIKAHNKYAERALSMSVLQNGVTRPIIVRMVNDHFEIVDGELLFCVLRKLHRPSANVFNLGDVSTSHAIKVYLQHNIFNEHLDYMVYVNLLALIKPDYSIQKMTDFLNMDLDDVEKLLKLEKFDINSFSKEEEDSSQHSLF